MVYTPRNAASVSADYSVPVGGAGAEAKLHLGANYGSSQYSFQNEPIKSDASFVVNGRLAIASVPMMGDTKATFALWSRNLFNPTYIYRRSAANDAVLGDYGNFNPPRTVGAQVRVKF